MFHPPVQTTVLVPESVSVPGPRLVKAPFDPVMLPENSTFTLLLNVRPVLPDNTTTGPLYVILPVPTPSPCVVRELAIPSVIAFVIRRAVASVEVVVLLATFIGLDGKTFPDPSRSVPAFNVTAFV